VDAAASPTPAALVIGAIVVELMQLLFNILMLQRNLKIGLTVRSVTLKAMNHPDMD